jgi:hypothetical protein
MVIFLDFDGVLHPVRSLTLPKFCRLPMFEDWLRARPGVDVVISSSWKEVHRFRELVEFFADDLQHRVIGCTPDYGRMMGLAGDAWPQTEPERERPVHEREAEIRRWMHQSWQPERPWVAVDDMPELFAPGCKQLVMCDPGIGLTAEVLAQLDLRLLSSGSRP